MQLLALNQEGLHLEEAYGKEDENNEDSEEDSREGASGLSRGPVDWTRDQLPCLRNDAILFASALEITFCALQKIFLVDGSGSLEIPAVEEVGFPGVGFNFRFGSSILVQLRHGDTFPANSVKEIPVNPEWEEPYCLIMECGGVMWDEMAINRDHLILLGPRAVHQGVLRKKPSLWNKETEDKFWERKYNF